MEQHDLFGPIEQTLPHRFRLAPDVVPDDQRLAVLEEMSELPFKAFYFHGVEGKRRTVSYGWKYDFGAQHVRKATIFRRFFYPCARCWLFPVSIPMAGLLRQRPNITNGELVEGVVGPL